MDREWESLRVEAEAGNAPSTAGPGWVWRAVCTRRQDGRVEGILPIPVPALSLPS